ncbi:alanyl-tRNA editing protein Aarsd1-like isoform X2 [Hydractinia symbiolongicarpus]|nr:alanyl-tRNA editing protein Aarsd1-like isoform X2 [Hydractinia symbiolongicarpus]
MEYKCVVDWNRRFDHMQQHSAQHLFSAIADTNYGFKTVSWELGRSVSHVELNAKSISKEQLVSIETECNDVIRNHNPVITHYLTKSDALELPEVKTRGLPEDVIEPIRVIEIKDVEKNMCCGTHVSNASDLQVIKLLHTEAMRGGTRVFFIAGNRVISKLDQSYEVERKLTKLLSCGIDEHADSVEKIKNNLRVSLKSCRGYLKEIAKFEADELVRTSKELGYIFKHREDGDMEYIFTILNSLPDHCKHVLTFICGGPIKTGGQFVLRGAEDKVQALSPTILELIDGKGGGKKGQLQGKAASFRKLKDVHELIKGAAKNEE